MTLGRWARIRTAAGSRQPLSVLGGLPAVSLGSLSGVLAAISAGTAAALAAGGLTVPALVLLLLTQGLGLLWIGCLGWAHSGTWANALVITAAAWALTFFIPAVLYVADPQLLDVTDRPVETLALLNLSLFCLALPIAFSHLRSGEQGNIARSRVRVRLGRWAPSWLWFWGIVGLVGLALVFRGAGGPIEYVTNLDQEGRFNSGRLYLVWMALFVRYAGQVALYRRWAEGRPASPQLLAVVVFCIGLTALLGARFFVAVALVEIALFYAIVRRPISLRVMLPVVAVLAFGVILLAGAAKRYSDYQTVNRGSDKGFGSYLVDEGRTEVADAYANNYADGVRLLALTRATVPDHGDFEYGKLLVRYAAQPIPRKWRPKPSRSDALERALYPGEGYAHAIPLQASAYIQAGPPGIVIVFLLLGAGVALLDRRLSQLTRSSITVVVVLTTLVVAIPSYLRSSEAGGFALAAVDVLGLGLVAFTADGGVGRLLGRASRYLPDGMGARSSASK